MPRKPEPRQKKRDLALEQFQAGCALVAQQPILAPLWYESRVVREAGNRCPADGWAVVTRAGQIHVHPTRRGDPAEWAYVLAHCLLHLGFGHFQGGKRPREWNHACDLALARFLADLKFGRPPEELLGVGATAARNEGQIYEDLCARNTPILEAFGTAGRHADDMVWSEERTDWHNQPLNWQEAFGRGLAAAVRHAVDLASGQDLTARPATRAQRARAWFIDHYPLLGALAAGFTIVEDAEVCRNLDISIAAVDAGLREIYFNPAAEASLHANDEEYRFVMAHELLHVGLRHHTRCQGRDHFLWNVACDYIINAWLVEMEVGHMPDGLLHDVSLKGMSAEEIYDLLVTDMRRFRKLMTLRGVGIGDILVRGTSDWGTQGAGVDLDEFYRSALTQGLCYHQDQGRGFLPAGLVEEIRALSYPPIPWDVALAQWFDAHFPPPELRRSYARPSRRQSSTPDIPRPRHVHVPGWEEGRTFGVVIDTSGSMPTEILGIGLGAIASYSIAREVPAVRVVFCDAAAYDAGYMPPEAIADRVQIKGRGGTVLQPGIDLLEHAEDFPTNGPLLIITDGLCDRVAVRRDHAFLLPDGRRLPFPPRGPVFYMKR